MATHISPQEADDPGERCPVVAIAGRTWGWCGSRTIGLCSQPYGAVPYGHLLVYGPMYVPAAQRTADCTTGPPTVRLGCRSEERAAAVLRTFGLHVADLLDGPQWLAHKLMAEIWQLREKARTHWRPGNERWRGRKGVGGVSMEDLLAAISGLQGR